MKDLFNSGGDTNENSPPRRAAMYTRMSTEHQKYSIENQTAAITRYAAEQGATAEETGEAAGCASLLASNNIFYRFRHFTKKEKYGQIPARIRMQLMMKPATGKEFFELMSLAISAVNGCELCVNAHEDSLIKLGTTEERIFDAVRIGSLVTATGKVIY